LNVTRNLIAGAFADRRSGLPDEGTIESGSFTGSLALDCACFYGTAEIAAEGLTHNENESPPVSMKNKPRTRAIL
jgi:hypothetical protein